MGNRGYTRPCPNFNNGKLGSGAVDCASGLSFRRAGAACVTVLRVLVSLAYAASFEGFVPVNQEG